MLKIFAIVGATLVLAAVAVLIVAATKPDTFSVKRTTSIKAPSDKIFAYIDDFRQWSAWSPYDGKDPAMKRTFSGAANGRGAVYEWDGDKSVGTGRMEIVDANSPTKVSIKLDFYKPFEAHNMADFLLEPKGETTILTWDMHGPNLYIGKIMQVFFDMDRMIGTDFEVGLANLKAIAEK
jgi:hypothetical protein